jgi:hypothetical protein
MPSQSTPLVLLAFANERQQEARYLRALPDESRAIQAALERAERAGLCELKILPNATPRDLVNAFQDTRYRDRIAALHYGGHAGSYQLLLEDSAWENQAADAAGLVPLLKNQKALQFVFLNGCSTEPLARALTDAGIPAVVGTFESVKDGVAQQLAQQFYAGFGNGLSLGRAWSEAIASVQLTEGGDPRSMGWGEQVLTRFPWDVFVKKGAEPVLDWNLPDAVGDPLFGLPELPNLDLPDTPYRFLNRYKKADAPLFFGRARYIRDLFERLTNPIGSPVVMLCGQSGVGKSSLLEAGLFPHLEQVCQLRYLRRDETVGLLGTLRNALGIKNLDADLRSIWKAAEKAKGKPLVIIMDQAEEAFTRPCPQEPEEIERFAQALSSIFSDPTDLRAKSCSDSARSTKWKLTTH